MNGAKCQERLLVMLRYLEFNRVRTLSVCSPLCNSFRMRLRRRVAESQNYLVFTTFLIRLISYSVPKSV